MDKKTLETIILSAVGDLEKFVKKAQEQGPGANPFEDLLNNFIKDSNLIKEDVKPEPKVEPKAEPAADNMLTVIDAKGKVVATIDKDFMLEHLLKNQ